MTERDNETRAMEDDEGLVPVTRRDLLQMAGAGMSLAALEGCMRIPQEKIVPYVKAPEEIVPGRPLYYASTLLFRGYGTGVLVESHMGRPTKIEGNRAHPSSRGGTDIFAQASLRTLYDPDRSQTVNAGGRISTFEALVEELIPVLKGQTVLKGAGLRIVSGAVTSPTLGAQLKRLLTTYPEARWYVHEPVSRENARLAAIRGYQRPIDVYHRFDRADVVVSLDADFLTTGPGAIRATRDFASRRRIRAADLGPAKKGMNRLYQIECAPTLTGAKADHRLALAPSAIPAFARALALEIGVNDDVVTKGAPGEIGAEPSEWVQAIAEDLAQHKRSSLVIAGDGQPPSVHLLAHAMNFLLDNFGRTAIAIESVEEGGARTDLEELADDMAAGKVQLVVFLGGSNPVYTAPPEIGFLEALTNVGLRIHHALFEDETSAHCHWHVPETHELEAWSDARGHDGTISIVQPVIAPLFAGKSAHEVLSALVGEPRKTSYEIVRERWKTSFGAASFEKLWETALHDGVLRDSAPAPLDLGPPSLAGLDDPLRPERSAGAAPKPGRRRGEPGDRAKESAERTIEVSFRPDPTIWDGRFANNAWLQEVPKPFSKVTWDNAIWIGKKTAMSLGVEEGEHLELSKDGRSITGPVWLMPGHAEGAATVFLGYGRTRAGRSGTGAGFDVYPLRAAGAPDALSAVSVRKVPGRFAFSVTQEEKRMHDRKLVRSASFEEFAKEPAFAQKMEHAPPKSLSLFPEPAWRGNQWGMSIDLSACTGCNACIVACQAENNVPTVGREQVRAGREMHWIRIDQYFEGSDESPEVVNQPVPCMHCENAPCELVCPVDATVHSETGLNEMVYNRCVGTRYCSHNCPYKVRRFNFLHFTQSYPDVLKLLMNPDVTVRSRGVMEKCTYCVQRINHARIDAKKQARAIKDGEIVTACEGACPAQAIVFGDIADDTSRVSRAKKEPLSYGILEELNTRPRTTYLARLTNPNLKLTAPKPRGPHADDE
jgi:Fe-S-cluster-containing dehydrogenase component